MIEHRDVFIWSHEDMPKIYNEVIVQHLCVNPAIKKVCQKKRPFSTEKYAAIA